MVQQFSAPQKTRLAVILFLKGRYIQVGFTSSPPNFKVNGNITFSVSAIIILQPVVSKSSVLFVNNIVLILIKKFYINLS